MKSQKIIIGLSLFLLTSVVPAEAKDATPEPTSSSSPTSKPTTSASASPSPSPSASKSTIAVPLTTRWISPSNTVSVRAGSEISARLTYLYSGSNTYSVSGLLGKKTINVVPTSVNDLPIIFPGQIVELVTNSNLLAIPAGAKVTKIKGNSITLSKSITANISGTAKFSGTAPVDSLAYLKILAVSCGSNTLAPFQISQQNSSSRDDDDERSYESSKSSLSIKWKVSKSQQLGCYNLVARFSPSKLPLATPVVVQPSDFKNSAIINVLARNKSKD